MRRASLLSQKTLDAAFNIANHRVALAKMQVRNMMYSEGPHSQPVGFDNLNSPDKVQLFSRFTTRMANRERRGMVPGNLAQTIAAHPDVQGMVAGAYDANGNPLDPSATMQAPGGAQMQAGGAQMPPPDASVAPTDASVAPTIGVTQ